MNHKKTPNPKKANMPAEMSLAVFVCQTFISCGNNEIVVKIAAIKPIIVVNSMGSPVLLFDGWYLVFYGVLFFYQGV